MFRCSRTAPALAVAAGAALVAAVCSVPSAAARIPGRPGPAAAGGQASRTVSSAGPPGGWVSPEGEAGRARAAATRSAGTISAGATPTTFAALAFPAPATGWLLGQAAGPAHTEIWHTDTVGATWQVQWQGPGSPLSISATDPAHAWALIACSGPRGSAPSCGRELVAWAATGRNGGACAPPFGLLYRYPAPGWQQLPPWQLTQVSALAAVSVREAYALSDQGVLSVTFDGGAMWTQLLPAPAPVGLVDAMSPGTAVAAQDQADAGAVLRSADGGRSWSQIADLPGVVTQLDFWSASDGIAATYQPDASSPWQLFASSDGGSSWAPDGSLPGGNTDIDGPWMSANGHGLLLTVTGGSPWEIGSGGIPPVRVWTTSDYGLTWSRGALLPFGRDSLAGPASFALYPGSVPGGPARWSGWLVIDTASFAQRVAVTNGGPLSLLPGTIPAGTVQLISPGAGLAWSLNYPSNPSVAVLALARTTDNGRRWLRSSIQLIIPAGSVAVPLLDFTDVNHGWLVLGNTTWHTADGGRTWTRG